MRRPLPLVLSLSFLYGELAVCSMPVPCSGLAMAPGGKFFFSLLCTNKELARFRLGGGEEEEGVGGGKLEAVDSTPSQHALAIHSMQFSPWGDLVLLGESLSAVQSMLRTRIRGTHFATDSDSDLILAHLDNVKTKNKIANLKGYSHEILNGCKWF